MLTGERVVLRAPTPADYPAVYAWRNELATWFATSPKPPVPEPYEAFVERYAQSVRSDTNAEFAIDVDGELVGRCGLFSVDPLSRHGEVGIRLGPEHRGKGYGREALRVLVAYAFGPRNLRRVWLETLASNTPALRAYVAAGFVEEARLREHAWIGDGYDDVVFMGALRSEWS